MLLGYVIALSVLFQFASICLALRLIKVSGGRIAWILISASIVLMGVRRCMDLFWLIAGDASHRPDLTFELAGLLTSILMLGGVAGIFPLFRTIKNAEAEQRTLVAQLQDALAKVKTLSGILPICASCKKIRDDKGYWNQVETYVRDHSEADFSHGICPECARKLYPEVFKGEE